MKRILVSFIILALSSPVIAAKWNQVTGEDLKTLYTDTVMTGRHKGTKFTVHNCADGKRSFMKFGSDDIKERIQTFPSDSEMCNEDDKGNRCYNIFQHPKKTNKLKWDGTNVSSSGKYKLVDGTTDMCN